VDSSDEEEGESEGDEGVIRTPPSIPSGPSSQEEPETRVEGGYVPPNTGVMRRGGRQRNASPVAYSPRERRSAPKRDGEEVRRGAVPSPSSQRQRSGVGRGEGATAPSSPNKGRS